MLNCYAVAGPQTHKSRLRRHTPSSRIRIVLLNIKEGIRNDSQSLVHGAYYFSAERAIVAGNAACPPDENGRPRPLAGKTETARKGRSRWPRAVDAGGPRLCRSDRRRLSVIASDAHSIVVRVCSREAGLPTDRRRPAIMSSVSRYERMRLPPQDTRAVAVPLSLTTSTRTLIVNRAILQYCLLT